MSSRNDAFVAYAQALRGVGYDTALFLIPSTQTYILTVGEEHSSTSSGAFAAWLQGLLEKCSEDVDVFMEASYYHKELYRYRTDPAKVAHVLIPTTDHAQAVAVHNRECPRVRFHAVDTRMQSDIDALPSDTGGLSLRWIERLLRRDFTIPTDKSGYERGISNLLNNYHVHTALYRLLLKKQLVKYTSAPSLRMRLQDLFATVDTLMPKLDKVSVESMLETWDGIRRLERDIFSANVGLMDKYTLVRMLRPDHPSKLRIFFGGMAHARAYDMAMRAMGTTPLLPPTPVSSSDEKGYLRTSPVYKAGARHRAHRT